MIENNRKLCCYCGCCVAVCPVNAITLDETKIIIDNEKCTNCMACVRICPVMAMKKKE